MNKYVCMLARSMLGEGEGERKNEEGAVEIQPQTCGAVPVETGYLADRSEGANIMRIKVNRAVELRTIVV